MIDFGSRTWPLLVLAAGDEPRQFLLLMGQQPFGSTPLFFFVATSRLRRSVLNVSGKGRRGRVLPRRHVEREESERDQGGQREEERVGYVRS